MRRVAFWLVSIAVFVVCLIREWRLAREEEVRERIRRAHHDEIRELNDEFIKDERGLIP